MRTGGALYGRRIYELMRYWDDERPDWGAPERDFAAAWRSKPKWVVSRTLQSVGPNATLVEEDVGAFARGLKRDVEGEIDVAGVLDDAVGPERRFLERNLEVVAEVLRQARCAASPAEHVVVAVAAGGGRVGAAPHAHARQVNVRRLVPYAETERALSAERCLTGPQRCTALVYDLHIDGSCSGGAVRLDIEQW